MSLQIRISSDALRSAAERQRVIQAGLDETTDTLGTQISQLRQAWEGNAGLQAAEILEELKKHAVKLLDATAYGASKLTGFCEMFEAIDKGEQISAFVSKFDVLHIVGCPRPTLFPFYLPGNVRIVPEELRVVATQCSTIAATYTEKADELRDLLNKLQNEWEGNAFNKYSEETLDLIAEFTKMADAIMEFADRIRTAALRYEEIDNMF